MSIIHDAVPVKKFPFFLEFAIHNTHMHTPTQPQTNAIPKKTKPEIMKMNLNMKMRDKSAKCTVQNAKCKEKDQSSDHVCKVVDDRMTKREQNARAVPTK